MNSLTHYTNMADVTQRVAVTQLLNARSDLARGLDNHSTPTLAEGQALLRQAESNCRAFGVDPSCIDVAGNIGAPRTMQSMRAELNSLRGKDVSPSRYDEGVDRSIHAEYFEAGEFARLAPVIRKAHKTTNALTLEALFQRAYRFGLEDGARGQRHTGVMHRTPDHFAEAQ